MCMLLFTTYNPNIQQSSINFVITSGCQISLTAKQSKKKKFSKLPGRKAVSNASGI